MGALTVRVDPDDLRRLNRSLKQLEPEAGKELRREFKRVMKPIQQEAQGNASWSSRIPAAIKISVTAKHVALKVNQRNAPHARAYEGLKGGGRTAGSFRHPVFRPHVWVSQPTRPYLKRAFDAHRDDAMDAAEKAIETASMKVGFR